MRSTALEKKTNYLLVLTAGVLASGTSTIASLAFLLRPVADDYSHGAYAIDGFWDSVLFFWSSWSGDIFMVAFLALLVGLPLVWLPFGASSAIAFLLTGIVVGGIATLALSLPNRLPGWRIMLVWSAVTFGWWTYLWSRELVFPDDDNRVLAEFLTHWQTVNVAYVLVPAINLVVFFALVEGRFSGRRFSPFLAVLLGLLLGTSGLVWGASLGAFVLLLAFGKWILTGMRSAVACFSYFLGAVVGILISVNSPGANNRRRHLPELDFPSAIFDAFRAAPGGVGNWFETVFSFQTLLALGIGMLTAWFSGCQLRRALSEKRALRLVLLLAPLSLLLSTISSISQIAAYEAPWHIVSTQLLVFLSAIVFGHYLYFLFSWLLSRASGLDLQIWVGKVTVLLAILGLLAAGTLRMAGSIVDRRAEWEAGNAPLLSASDRNEEWVNGYWIILENHRSRLGQN